MAAAQVPVLAVEPDQAPVAAQVPVREVAMVRAMALETVTAPMAETVAAGEEAVVAVAAVEMEAALTVWAVEKTANRRVTSFTFWMFRPA